MSQSPTSLAPDIIADWRMKTACVGFPYELFFPNGDAPSRAIERALSVCSICPVTADCLEYALETNQRSGIWGGTTEDQRRSLRRKWLAARRRAS